MYIIPVIKKSMLEGKWSMSRHSALHLGSLNMNVSFSEAELKMDDAPTFFKPDAFKTEKTDLPILQNSFPGVLETA